MKKRALFALLSLLLMLSSCSMEATIPENDDTFSLYFDHNELFDSTVEIMMEYEQDVMISKNNYYSVSGSENFTGMYLQNMSDGTFSEFLNETVQQLMDTCGVKLIDLVHKNSLTICAFDLCIPGRNFDYGIYYVSVDEPVYLGDVTFPLEADGNGFSYQQKASYGTQFTFYTEKITPHYYYYEIS